MPACSARAASIAVACLLALGAGAPSATAQRARLATPPGDGGVSIDVDAYGAFGYRTFGNGSGGAGDAIYDPVGAVGPSSTSWESALYLRRPGQSTFLTIGTVGMGTPSGSLPDPGFLTQDGISATSAFRHAGLDWELAQDVRDVRDGAGVRVGSLLVQRYLIRNGGTVPVSFDLVRYYEGDLFLGLGAGVPDGGGRLVTATEELLFQTDRAGEPAATTNLIGITACGGTTPVRGRYEVGQWSAFPTRITSDQPLGDVVFNDGADADEFVDAGLDYDVGIALANVIDLAPGAAIVYVTTTVFGTLPPADLSTGCGTLTQAVAAAGSDVVTCPGSDVTLDGSASFDPDPADGGMTPSWTWDLDVAADSGGNGVPNDDADALGPVVTAPFPLGTTTVQLTYSDDDGDVGRDLVVVTVADAGPPVVNCTPEIVVPPVSFDGAPVTVLATVADDCGTPAVRNDRTANGADASDDYPCGWTLVTFTAQDLAGNTGSCSTLVRVVPDPVDWSVGPALRVTKEADSSAHLDWSLAGPPPTNVRFAVLRETAQAHPTARAPGAAALLTSDWIDPVRGEWLVLYDVRGTLCDGTLSPD